MRVGNGFDGKRSSKERIVGWSRLQEIMQKHGIINSFEAIMNKIYIRAFVYTPVGLKKWLYDKMLRK